jgi:hypothetical protein
MTKAESKYAYLCRELADSPDGRIEVAFDCIHNAHLAVPILTDLFAEKYDGPVVIRQRVDRLEIAKAGRPITRLPPVIYQAPA